MKTYLSFLFFLVVAFINMTTAIAQLTLLPAEKLRVYTVVSDSVPLQAREITPDSIDIFLQNTPVKCTFTFLIPDTVGIMSIKARLGTSVGGNELANYSYTFDNTQPYTDGRTYRRKGNRVWLGLGTLPGIPPSFFASVRLEDANGGLSASATYKK